MTRTMRVAPQVRPVDVVRQAIRLIVARYGLDEPSVEVDERLGYAVVRLTFARRVPSYARDEMKLAIAVALGPLTRYPSCMVISIVHQPPGGTR